MDLSVFLDKVVEARQLESLSYLRPTGDRCYGISIDDVKSMYRALILTLADEYDRGAYEPDEWVDGLVSLSNTLCEDKERQIVYWPLLAFTH